MKKYINSEIKVDKLSDFFKNRNYNKIYKKEIENKDFDIKTTQKKEVKNGIGYCIRTGKEIAFNIERPMEYEAFKMWNKFKNPDFPEKYCHFSGELSNGETSVNKPILSKNWRKAKERFNL